MIFLCIFYGTLSGFFASLWVSFNDCVRRTVIVRYTKELDSLKSYYELILCFLFFVFIFFFGFFLDDVLYFISVT